MLSHLKNSWLILAILLKTLKSTHIFWVYIFFFCLCPLFIFLVLFFLSHLKVPRKLGKIGCVKAYALTGILPTLACNAANNRWGMGWRRRRGGRHEVGMGVSSWDARLEHEGTIWQGTFSIFSRIFWLCSYPSPVQKNMSMPDWESWILEVAHHSNQSLAWQCQRYHLARTHGSRLDACRLVTNLSWFCEVYNQHIMSLIM